MQIVISAIKELLETSVSNGSSPINSIKKVFFGDPIIIPEADLPALAIQPINSEYVMRGSRYDQKLHRIEIRLIYNMKDYFSKNFGSQIAIESAIFSVNQITFEATAHGLTLGTSVVISGCDPSSFNGTFLVASVPDVNHFVVAKTIDPGTFVSGGTMKSSVNDKMFSVEDAIKKVETMNTDHSTAKLSVCGTIQSNPMLPYSDGAVTRNAAEIAQIRSVNYTFNENRGFPTFEVVTTLEATVIGDR